MTVPNKLDRLIQILRERSFERRRVILASGKESDFFIDCKQTILTAEGHALVGELMFEALDNLPACEAVGGSTTQSLPALVAVACSHIGIVLVDDMLDADPRGEHLRAGAPAVQRSAVMRFSFPPTPLRPASRRLEPRARIYPRRAGRTSRWRPARR